MRDWQHYQACENSYYEILPEVIALERIIKSLKLTRMRAMINRRRQFNDSKRNLRKQGCSEEDAKSWSEIYESGFAEEIKTIHKIDEILEPLIKKLKETRKDMGSYVDEIAKTHEEMTAV